MACAAGRNWWRGVRGTGGMRGLVREKVGTCGMLQGEMCVAKHQFMGELK